VTASDVGDTFCVVCFRRVGPGARTDVPGDGLPCDCQCDDPSLGTFSTTKLESKLLAAGHRLDARLTRERDEARSAYQDSQQAEERMLADRDRWQASARLWAELHRLSMLTLREWVDAAWRLSVTHNEPSCRAKAEVALRALDAWAAEAVRGRPSRWGT
jgi:hypothetical protein